jgi:hypothetical protein
MATSRQFIPIACKDGLIIKEVEGETLVYDLKSHKAHCLNRTAALVWKHCDGKRTVQQLTSRLEADCGERVSAEVVWLALDQLERLGLLKESRERAPAVKRISRREVVRKIGISTAVALPLVTSILAPKAAQAATCTGPEEPCGVGIPPCCEGVCCRGACLSECPPA